MAAAICDWIARNDDRAVDDPTPLIDAPLTAGCVLTLVVEFFVGVGAGLADPSARKRGPAERVTSDRRG